MQKLLFLDDDQGNFDLLLLKIEHTPMQATHAKSVDEAIELMAKGVDFDTIMIDHDLCEADTMAMPWDLTTEKTGSDFVDWLVSNKAYIKMPGTIILHSNNTMGNQSMRKVLRGAEFYSEIIRLDVLKVGR